MQYDPRKEFIQLRPGEQVSEYIVRHVKDGKIFVGCEGTEPGLADAIRQVGHAFLFSSDFPHEVNTETCREEIEELRESPDLTDADKAAILHGNALSFYSLT